MELIYHLTRLADWNAAQVAGEYRRSTRDRTLEEVGFIHCASDAQVEQVANRLYRGMSGLAVLAIDIGRVEAPVRYENLEGGDELFPHLYGPLPPPAVVSVQRLEPLADGRVRFPVPGAAVLETARLRLRELQPDDAGPLYEVVGDPATMRFYPAPWSRKFVGQWIERNRASYEKFGFGLWAMILKESGGLIGECGLSWQAVGYSEVPELEAGWHVRRDLWNRGLAKEAAHAVLALAREMGAARRLVSLISVDNVPSQAVALAVGMRYEREDVLDGNHRLVYSLDL